MSTDPRDITGPVQFGTSLRDAAVDPKGSDFLPPINAGTAGDIGNPHGVHVISPGIHGLNRIASGAVSDDADTQEAAEYAALYKAFPGNTAPSVTGADPESAPVAGGDITITGSGFTGTTAVKFAGTDADSFTVDSDGQITATIPAGTASADASITVTNAIGTSDAFTYAYAAA